MDLLKMVSSVILLPVGPLQITEENIQRKAQRQNWQLNTGRKEVAGHGKYRQSEAERKEALRPSEELADLAEGIFACFMQSSWSSSKLLRAFNWFTISVNRSQSRQK